MAWCFLAWVAVFFLSETARPNSCSAVSHEAGEGELCDLTEGLFAAHRLCKVKETDSWLSSGGN